MKILFLMLLSVSLTACAGVPGRARIVEMDDQHFASFRVSGDQDDGLDRAHKLMEYVCAGKPFSTTLAAYTPVGTRVDGGNIVPAYALDITFTCQQ